MTRFAGTILRADQLPASTREIAEATDDAIAMDIEQARFNMVEQQIRPWEVLDQDVLDLLFTVRREDFVPPAYRSLAFADLEMPLPGGERMWSPKMEARVLQELKLTRGESRAGDRHRQRLFHRAAREPAAEVTSVEIDPQLAASARGQARAARLCQRRSVEVGDGARGMGQRTL